MNWSSARTSLLLVVAMSERLPGLRGSLRPDMEVMEATRGGPGGHRSCSPKTRPGDRDLCLVKEGLGLTGDMEQLSGSVLCLTGGVAFLLRMEWALTPPPEPV